MTQVQIGLRKTQRRKLHRMKHKTLDTIKKSCPDSYWSFGGMQGIQTVSGGVCRNLVARLYIISRIIATDDYPAASAVTRELERTYGIHFSERLVDRITSNIRREISK